MAEKPIEEEALKGLEKEIDAAVDRLFVEKGKEPLKNMDVSPSPMMAFQKTERKVEWETVFPAPLTPPPLKSIENLETQLLSLEWEITKENLRTTVEEVLALKGDFKGNTDLCTLLNQMTVVLNFMIRNEEGIQPHLIQFLLDSKETIKLLMRNETEGDIGIYKKLTRAGMEARFSCLEEIRGMKPRPSSVQTEEVKEKAGASLVRPELLENILQRMESSSAKVDEMIEKMNRHLAAHERPIEGPVARSLDEKQLKTKVTVFKMGETLLGVGSENVFKLFKVPFSLREKFTQLTKVRLKGLEVRMIDLENIFSISEAEREEERQVLVLKGRGEYKGLMIDRVLNRLAGPMEQGLEFNECLLGMIRWTYQGLPLRVPILDFEKL